MAYRSFKDIILNVSCFVFGRCVAPVFPLRNEIPASDCVSCFLSDKSMFDILHEDERPITRNQHAANVRAQKSCCFERRFGQQPMGQVISVRAAIFLPK